MAAKAKSGRASDDLIVIAAFDDRFEDNVETFTGAERLVVSTRAGGHPSQAFINAYREHKYAAYLFVQDSMRGIGEDVVAPFRGNPVTAWATFPFNFDSEEQAAWVHDQYPGRYDPPRGIFGPTFYATREALEQAEPFFPLPPPDKHMAQGTERAWAFCFAAAGVPVVGLYDFSQHALSNGDCPPFSKVFANRQ